MSSLSRSVHAGAPAPAVAPVLALVLALAACAASPEAPPPSPPSPEEADSDQATVVASTRDARDPSVASAAEHEAVALGPAAVMAPPIGQGAGVALHGADGSTTWLEIARDDQGVVRVVDHGELATPLASSSPPACKDGAYKLSGFAWKRPYEWWFRAGSTPSSLGATRAESTLRWAASTISSGRNDCGMSDRISAAHAYKGRTTRGTNVVSTKTSVTCGSRDGFNVVAFGVLPERYLGVACYWYDADGALEADVKLNDHYHRWFAGTKVPAGCTSAYSLAGVAVHELGHAFGLGHVAETTHANLTMSTMTGPCSVGPGTLGRGDVLGLRARY
jgi:hypothetical protein